VNHGKATWRATFTVNAPRGIDKLGSQIDPKATPRLGKNQAAFIGARLSKRDHVYSVTLIGQFQPPEFRVDVIAPNEGVWLEAYCGPHFDRALKVALEEADFHGLPLGYSFSGPIR
jgi:hypothetical protein